MTNLGRLEATQPCHNNTKFNLKLTYICTYHSPFSLKIYYLGMRQSKKIMGILTMANTI